jgi:hypothetical protein
MHIRPFKLFTNGKRRWFLKIKRPKSSKKKFCYTSSFLKGVLAEKNLNMELEEIFGFFPSLKFWI